MVALLPGLYSYGNPLHRHNTCIKDIPTATQSDRQAFFRELADRLGLTQTAKFVHVAGTKGKGSTCEYIAAGLRESGARVGVFTSPHLHTARERIKIGLDLIPGADFIRLTRLAYEEMSGKPWVVFFDLFLCMALHYFGENNVDYIVLETGIGGMYDSTNFVLKPLVTVITNIGLDHQNILGNTIEEIALQKAGIIKPGVPVFTTLKQEPTVMTALACVADERGALLQAIAPSSATSVTSKSSYSVQLENIAVAVAVLRSIGIDTSAGLSTFYWPCRMELFSLPCRGQGGVPFIVDGNHNGESTRLFLQGLRKAYPDRRVVILFGSGADKCMGDMTEEVAVGADIVIPVQANHFKATAINRVIDVLMENSQGKQLAQVMGLSVEQRKSTTTKVNGKIADNIYWLIEQIRCSRGIFNEDIVVGTCGSLFVACETREFLFEIIPEAFGENDWVRYCDGI